MSLVFVSSLLIPLCYAAHWEYDEDGLNVTHWAENWPECGGTHQSPIDVTFSVEDIDKCEDPVLLDFTSEMQHFAIRNSGHSLQAVPLEIEHAGGSEISGLEILHHTNDTTIRLQNSFYSTYESAVNKEYCFDSMHFHWGETNDYGSEHFLNGESFPLELHLVHYSCDYYRAGDALNAYKSGALEESYDDDNILAVVGILFEIGEANPVLDEILNDYVVNAIQTFESNPEYSNFIEIYYTEFDLMDLLPENKEVIGYKGSLTTPPCYETVRWHVMKQPMTVSIEQMVRFRMILESTELGDFMAPNWRPLQDLNDRTLYECKSGVDAHAVEKEPKNDVLAIETTADGEDHDSEHEKDGSTDNLMWVGIGVAFIVICYLTYIIHCKESSPAAHPNKQHLEQELSQESHNLVDVSTVDI